MTVLRPTLVAMLLAAPAAWAQAPAGLGTEEFGLTPRQLIQSIEQVEGLISKCMRAQGFQYVAADYTTVMAGMNADKKLPGVSEDEFITRFGFGVSTMYTGQAPQVSTGYSPARVGLGDQNVSIFKSLSPADQVAYNRALFGENTEATLAVALETENLAATGGCTRAAMEKTFKPDQLKGTYYNPQDALINNDPRMKAALRRFAAEMKKAGYDYNHPDEVEPDVRARLAALTDGSRVTVEQMSPAQRASLKELQDYERAVAAKTFKLQDELLGPVEETIQQELFSRKVQ